MQLLRPNQVAERLSISRMTLYRMVARGAFPEMVKLSPRCVGWLEADVAAWLEAAKR